MKHKLFTSLALVVLSLLLWQCARRGAPTGGPKDTTPPVLVQAIPPSGSLHFKAKKIRLQFNEFVVTKDVRKQLIISPPMKTFPVISPTSASKWLEINIADTLKPNTTYVLNFGNSIQDYNENNPLVDFKYVFSTGSTLDSLWYEGDIADAIAPTPDNFVTVMLYPYNQQYSDSLVYKTQPTYVTNTLDSLTSFVFDYLKEGAYKLIALKEKSPNYLFNPKDDKIAFLNEPITVKDLKGNPQGFYPKLKLFKEKLPYKAHRPTQMSASRISFGFEGGTQSVTIKPISPVTNDFQFTLSKEPKKDTLNLWYTPKQMDSIVFTVAKAQKIDTFKVRLKEMKKDSLQLEPLFSSDLPLTKRFGFKSNIPLVKVDSSKIKIFKGKDSIPQALPFKAQLNEHRLEYYLDFEKKHDETYRIEVLPHAMTDFFGHTNDTLKLNFRTKKQEDLAIFKVHLKTDEPQLTYPVLLQLTNEKAAEVMQEQYIEKPLAEYLFENVVPSKYRLRLIEDRNANRQWDTGNFLQQLQPERVWYFPALIELRANWEVEENWELKDE